MSSYVPNLTSMTGVDLQPEKPRGVPSENESLRQRIEEEQRKNGALRQRIEVLDREVKKSMEERRQMEESFRNTQRLNSETVDSLKREIIAINESSKRRDEENKASFDRDVTELKREKDEREELFESMCARIIQVISETKQKVTADSKAV